MLLVSRSKMQVIFMQSNKKISFVLVTPLPRWIELAIGTRSDYTKMITRETKKAAESKCKIFSTWNTTYGIRTEINPCFVFQVNLSPLWVTWPTMATNEDQEGIWLPKDALDSTRLWKIPKIHWTVFRLFVFYAVLRFTDIIRCPGR